MNYYNPSKILSYDRLLNFVIGARGFGKTYGFKKFLINQFLKHGYEFVYVRRFKSELKKINKFFDSVKEEFPNVKFEVKGNSFYINKKIAGYAIPLSSWQTEKSSEYPKVKNMLFDEFIREKDMSRYLPNEVDAFLNLMDTVFRSRDGRVICLSNAVTVVNPYFVYFSIVPDLTKQFYTKGQIVLEIADSKDFVEERKQTKFGQLIQDTHYAEMALENKFTGDNYTFVERRSKQSDFLFAITYKGDTVGIWYDDSFMYVSSQYDVYTKKHFVINKDDMKDGTIYCKNQNSQYYLKKFVSAFNKGLLKFDSIQIRNVGYEILKRL